MAGFGAADEHHHTLLAYARCTTELPCEKWVQRHAGGGAGESGLRTSFGIKLVVGMPLAQTQLAPFVAAPFQFTWKSSGPDAGSKAEREIDGPTHRHPICKVLDWQDRLKAEKGLCKAQIGHAEGLSKARMTQMFSLLKLPQEAREHLVSLRSPAVIKFFSIRRLIEMAKLPAARQVEEFDKLRASSPGYDG